MSENEIKKYIKNLSDDDKKVRQSACESLQARGILLTNNDMDVLQSAVKALKKAIDDKDRGVRKRADEAHRTLSNHVRTVQQQSSTGWGSTAESASSSSTSYQAEEGVQRAVQPKLDDPK